MNQVCRIAQQSTTSYILFLFMYMQYVVQYVIIYERVKPNQKENKQSKSVSSNNRRDHFKAPWTRQKKTQVVPHKSVK